MGFFYSWYAPIVNVDDTVIPHETISHFHERGGGGGELYCF